MVERWSLGTCIQNIQDVYNIGTVTTQNLPFGSLNMYLKNITFIKYNYFQSFNNKK